MYVKGNLSSVLQALLILTIINAKADYCVKFKDELLSSGRKNLVETVMGDIFWSSCFPPRVA